MTDTETVRDTHARGDAAEGSGARATAPSQASMESILSRFDAAIDSLHDEIAAEKKAARSARARAAAATRRANKLAAERAAALQEEKDAADSSADEQATVASTQLHAAAAVPKAIAAAASSAFATLSRRVSETVERRRESRAEAAAQATAAQVTAQAAEPAPAQPAPAEAVAAASTAPSTAEPTAESTVVPRPVREPVREPKRATPTRELPKRVAPLREKLTRDADTEILFSVRDLTKRFGDTIAVDAIDLDIARGRIVGIVGPNGAGKTTTLAMLTGMLRPDGGTAILDGHDVWDDPSSAKRRMGIVPDRLRTFDRLTGAQLLHYAGSLRGLDGTTVHDRSADLARAFGLEDSMRRLVSDYSSGMKKKLALAAALIHSPRLLVLDEPFESVDAVSIDRIVRLLFDYARAGGTVILTSHSLGFVEDVCDEVAIMVGGRLHAFGAVDDVRGALSLEERFIEIAESADDEDLEWLTAFSS